MSRYGCVAFGFALASVFGGSAAAETSPEIEIQASRELAEEIRSQLLQQELDASQIFLTPVDQREVDETHGELPAAAPEQDPSFDDPAGFTSEPIEADDVDDLLVDDQDADLDAAPPSDVASPAKQETPVEPPKPDYENGVEPDSDVESQDPDSDIETRDPDEDPAAIDEDEEIEADDEDE